MSNSIQSAFFKSALLVGTLFGALSQAAGGDLWRSEESQGHYFLKDYVNNTYVETIDCKAVFTFKTVASTTGLRLYDASRNVYVELQNGTMWLKVGSGAWSKFRKGRFDHRTAFNHEDGTGGITGVFYKKNACGWAEHLDGTANASFRFTEVSTDAGAVTMYDHSRNLYVKLTSDRMFLRTGSTGAFNFFKKGGWY